ncbi:hypothetical protein TVAG_156780 [Trichomonas vaginalis G3]|uniref:Protein kinase domain-containing protein n=1 Tax=Trichomonas vaginalis (strain ATCC PRA-98 / G3) TaxID=412133 RepID=A2FZ64_TRIV3|nr:protein serine/threonine kinase protein [Trichomonas vaginalis G3]EAX89798.1 hypothetical protein TVAG_156780 [Trichomonas vaginalis G3]KAI5538363.1 protein serine/threonine kinase protein [Trichomonas vaginalis G3]|eukprot:XP_001302728.1 hypothetical protein [Trichomonas vaginalis G3]
MDQGELSFFNNIGIQYCKPIASGGYGSISLVYWARYQTYFALKKIPVSKFKETEVECMKKLD